MLEKTASKINTTAALIKKHRAKVAVVTTLGVVLYIDRARVKEWNQFLLENNLFDQFYTLVD